MTPVFASPCQCANCPGAGCTCGCQQAGPAAPQAYPAACSCSSCCGCEASESGCVCPAPEMAG